MDANDENRQQLTARWNIRQPGCSAAANSLISQLLDSGPAGMSSLKQFDWLEYSVFAGLLGASALIGGWVALRRPQVKEGTSVEDYMLGGRRMPLLPVALSLAASFVSGISLLGLPAETYLYGTQLFTMNFTIILCYILTALFYLPVIYQLRLGSLFEYLELRFDKSVRTLGSCVYALSVLFMVPIVIYVPALAFNQVTGVSIHIVAPMVCAVCIFYTALGGLRAVVWSDALQTCCVILAFITVTVVGTRRAGGLQEVIRRNNEGERLEMFNFDPDPTARNTFWTATVGPLTTWLMSFAANPSTVQRYISLASHRQAQLSLLLMTVGVVSLKSLSTFSGLIIYAVYQGCDPLITKEVSKSGQLLPHLVMEVSQNYPGLAGLFMAGVLCTALSTMSTMLNTIAGVVYEDLVSKWLPWKETGPRASRTIQLITVALGILTTALVFLVEKLGTIMQVSVTLQGITNGAKLFMFTFGMFIPCGNSQGVKWGTAASLLTSMILTGGAQYFTLTGQIVYGTKLRTVDQCPPNITTSRHLNSSLVLGYPGEGTRVFFSDWVPTPFRLSYLYPGLVGMGVATLVGLTVSLLTSRGGGEVARRLDPALLIPQLRPALVKEKERLRLHDYSRVPTQEFKGSLVQP